MENKKRGRPRVYLTEEDFYKWRDGTFFHFKVITQAQLAAIIIILGLVLALLLR